MELHEFYSRKFASWPPKKLVTSNSATRITQILVLFVVAFICVCSASSINNNKLPPWPHIEINGQADNIISSDRDDSIFFTVNGDIFKYNRKLELLSSTKNSTSSEVTYNETNIFTNKVLSIINEQKLLLSCWRLKNDLLKCQLNKLNILTTGTLLAWPNGSKGFKIGSTDKIGTLTSYNDASDLLFVNSKTNSNEIESDTSIVPYLPAIGKYKISKSQTTLILESKSVLQHASRFKNLNIFQEYIYLFDHNHFTYFILNDIQKPNVTSLPIDDGLYNARIARICNTDTNLFSYTEISLTCNSQKDISAKYAYLDLAKIDPTLYVVFESIIDLSSSAKKSSTSSSICSYSMKLIDDLFHKAVSDCNDGNPASNLLMKYHFDNVDTPPLCQRNPTSSDEWCTSKTNPFIDGTSYRYNVHQDDHLSLSGITSINFLYTTQQGPELRDVIFIGTVSGYLTKMSSEEDLFYTINLNHKNIKNYKMGEKFNLKVGNDETKDAKYTVSSRSILVTSQGLISRLDIDECYYYTSCRACLSTSDPLKCVWCGNTCSRRIECDIEKQSTESCPPIIKSFHPVSGPISGSTKLVIEGENFGLKGSLKVKLNEQDCLIERRLSDGEIIECLTKPIDGPLNATISVDVSDDSSYIYSKGVTVADKPFVFARPKVYGLYPESGTLLGGTKLTIYGENLHTGLHRNIFLGDMECDIEDFKREMISCMTRPLRTSIQREKNTSDSYLLEVLIDGHEQLLEQRSQFEGFNLTTNFIYTIETTNTIPITTTTMTSIPNATAVFVAQEGEKGFSYVPFTILTILILASLVVLFIVISKDKIPLFKLKLPITFKSRNDKVDDVKVSYRSPNPNSIDPINGLVKLNGSLMSSDYFCKPEQLEQDQPLMMNTFLDNEMASILVQEKILIDRNRLTLGHVLGSGQFGRVYKGFFKIEETGEHTAVAVKTLHNKSSWDEGLDNRAFLEEGLMMKDFEHENVLALIGVTFDSNGLPMVITPFMLYGDLRSYISDEASSPTVKELIDFGTQIAKGMAYLSNLKFVHRDLAARNCMLDENLVVKVADFGLSRDIYERDYYSSDNKKAKLPVKWMAIESLETCIYNTKTDVWSYGIVLWELLTRGVVPYPDVDNFDLFSYLKEGRRMLRPRYCPLILYKIMLSCWSENPANRPTFEELVQKVSDVITQLKIAKDGLQKVSREVTYCDVIK